MIYFVSGIDTDAGKSIATGWLAQQLQHTQRVITQKFVQTGNKDISEDIVRHRKMMGCGLLPEDETHLTMPEIYTYPCSPHLAAQIDHRPIDLAKIQKATETLAQRYDTVFLEGAGGLMVPLTERYLTIDYIKDHNYPLIFIISGKLGSINHALLSLEAIATRKITLAKVIYNHFPCQHDPIIDQETCRYLKQIISERFPETQFEEMPVLCDL